MGLLAFEQKLDATLTRKKLDIQEALKRPMKIKRKLRIYVSHSFIPGKEPEVRTTTLLYPEWATTLTVGSCGRWVHLVE